MAGNEIRVATIGSGSGDRVPLLRESPLAAGLRIEAYEPRLSTFPRTPYDRLVADVAFVDMAERAAEDGCGAVFLDTTCDFGIDAIRAAIDVPVVGAGEASIAVAAADDRSFSIVTVWPESLNDLHDERLRAVPGGEQCVGVRNVSPETELDLLGTEESVLARMQRRESAVVERLVAECERAVDEDHAECIVLGCTCMAPVAAEVAARVSVPVLDGCRIGFLVLVATLGAPPSLHEASLSTRTGLLSSLVGAWLGQTPPPVAAEAEPCPVCVTVV